MSLRSARLSAALVLLVATPAAAEDFYCEVMAIEGTVTRTSADEAGAVLEEGDLLAADDMVQTGPSSFVDLAYDRDWNNVTRLEENSSLRIRSLVPAELELDNGGVFAKLKALPKDSSFDVQTPTAVASVRGTEYRTTYIDGQTEVENVSDSDVYVYGFDNSGRRQPEPVVVRNAEKTQVAQRGQKPAPPRHMQPQELARAAQFREKIEKKVRENVERGRFGRMQGALATERFRDQHERKMLKPDRQGPPEAPRKQQAKPPGKPGPRPQPRRQ